MYEISEHSGNIRNTQTNVVFPQDDRNENYPAFHAWQKNEGTPIYVSFFEGEEDEKKVVEFMTNLQATAAELRIKAKAAAIGKTGTNEYIFSQVELYDLKFKVASGVIVNTYITSLIENEAAEYGLTIELFKQLIIDRYNEAKTKYEVFLFMIERCRTKIQTLVESANFLAVETAFVYIENLSDASQAEQTMTNILAL